MALSQFVGYYNEGGAAYAASRHRDAAALFARAKEAAQRGHGLEAVFKAGFWEAEARQQAGDGRTAHALLLSLLAEAKDAAPTYERWLAERLSYELWLALGRRTRAERTARLRQLEGFAAGHSQVPPGDLPELWAWEAEAAADWAEALRHWEKAWMLHDGYGLEKTEKAFGALRASLRLGREAEAIRWLDLLGKTGQGKAYGRLDFHQGMALLALFRANRAGLDAARIFLEAHLAGTQDCNNASTRHLLARLWLLLRPRDDPENPSHPARVLLRQRPEIRTEWGRLLALADFRLAAVRHAAGLPACDDLYHHPPQVLPAVVQPSDPEGFARRVQLARRLFSRLRRMAEGLDRRNGCAWYGGEARAREVRLDAIEQALAVYDGGIPTPAQQAQP